MNFAKGLNSDMSLSPQSLEINPIRKYIVHEGQVQYKSIVNKQSQVPK